jgi:hypothetical protein
VRYRIALAALAAVVLVSPRVHAGDDDKVDPAYEKKVLGDAERIQKKVEKLRGLKYQAPVAKGVQTEGELKKQLTAEFLKPENKEDVEKEGKVAKAFGLVPQDFKWAEEQATLLGEQIAGFYDNEGKKLRLVQKKLAGGMTQDMQDANDETVMAHELTHALQDQNFDLGRWFSLVEGNTDRTSAYKCIVEGEATLMMFMYMFDKQGTPMMDMKTLWSMNKSMADMVPGAKEQQEKLDKLPPYLVGNLMMSYEDGSIFVQAIYDKGGWDAVTKLFQDPPTSTQQVLHPKKYFDRVEPADITMPSIAKALKAKAIDGSTFGEYNLRLILEAHGVKKKAAKKIAAGWHGDQFQVIELEGGKVGLAWLTTWETEDAAKAFEEAYRPGLEKRLGDGLTLERRGTEVLQVDAEDATVREKIAKKAWCSALQDAHMKPFPSMLVKPPAKDFTETDESKGFGMTETKKKTIALGERVNDEEVGYSLRIPAGWKKQDGDTIKEIKEFSRGLWKTDGGSDMRILDLPMPFDKDNLVQQFETLVRKGTREFKKESESQSKRGGHDALEVQFEGIIPDGTNQKVEARAIAVERDQMTLIFMLSAPKGKLGADLPALDAALDTLKFAGHALADEKEWKQRHGDEDLVLSSGGLWRNRSLDSDRLELDGPEGKGLIRAVAARATSSDIAAESKATEALRAKFLASYRLLGSSTVEHEHLGTVYIADFEFKTKEGEARRARELVALSHGERLSVTCSSDPESFEKLRPVFERAIATFHVARDGKAPEPKAEPKHEPKPKAEPNDKDEPF